MSTENTRAIVQKYFDDLASGDLPAAFAALAPDIEFELPKDEWNQVIPYLGRHHGVDAVARAFDLRAQTTEVLDYGLRALTADGDTAFAVVHTKAAHTRTRQIFAIEDTHRLDVDGSGRIFRWKVYFDPNSEVAAFNADREPLLLHAVETGDAALAAQLIAAGADVDHRDPASGLTPLMIAAGAARPDLVRMLIDAGADVHTAEPRAGAMALHKACQGGSVEVVTALVEAGAFVDSVAPTTGHTPLMDALWYKYPDVVKYLLDQGAGLDVRTSYGFTLKEHFEYELGVNTLGKDRLELAEQYLTERQESDRRKVVD